MAKIASKPFILRDMILALGATNTFEAHVSRVAFIPTSAQVTWQPITPDASFTGTTAATWACEITGVQDWETADSLARYLWDNEGAEIQAVFTPKKGVVGSDKFTVTLTVAAPTVGGDANTVPQFTVTMGCKAKPVRSAVAA